MNSAPRSKDMTADYAHDPIRSKRVSDEHLMDFSSGVADHRMTATILLIDDNAVQAATRQTILKRAGYFVIAALNPARALEQFQSGEFPAEIGLVITDHLMPGMSGVGFVKGLRKTHPTLPVMVISGLEEAEEQYAGLHVTFRLKPVLPELLLASVHGLLRVGQTTATTPVCSVNDG
jgi:DNA-binding response OmpR family regulator